MAVNSRGKYFFLIALSILLIILSAFIFMLTSERKTGAYTSNKEEISQLPETINTEAPTKSNGKIDSSIPSAYFSKADWEDIKAWNISQGWFDFLSKTGAVSDYNSYDSETLEKMSDGGDLKAMYVLAKKLRKEHGKGFSAAEPYIWKSAIYGSTAALVEIGQHHANRIRLNETLEERRKYAVDAFSYYQAAAMRGDRTGVVEYAYFTMRVLDLERFNPTQEEKVLIQVKATEIYRRLSSERNQMGLGDFDTTTPEVVDRFLAKEKKSINVFIARKYNFLTAY